MAMQQGNKIEYYDNKNSNWLSSIKKQVNIKTKADRPNKKKPHLNLEDEGKP